MMILHSYSSSSKSNLPFHQNKKRSSLTVVFFMLKYDSFHLKGEIVLIVGQEPFTSFTVSCCINIPSGSVFVSRADSPFENTGVLCLRKFVSVLFSYIQYSLQGFIHLAVHSHCPKTKALADDALYLLKKFSAQKQHRLLLQLCMMYIIKRTK